MTHATNLLPEGLPEARGLYDPRHEHDACGIGLIANIHNLKSHKIISDGLSILHNLEHRGAVGADPKAGDGAGILLQIPHEFFIAEAKRLGFIAVFDSADERTPKFESWIEKNAPNAERMIMTTRRFFRGHPGPAISWKIYISPPTQ